nr:hypothetical protein [Fischerella thermalis]
MIKLMRNEYPSFNELVQFRNQYTIAKNLDIPGIVQPLSLETYGNGYALVMEDFGGISLQEWIKQNIPSVEEFLDIAIQITLFIKTSNRLIFSSTPQPNKSKLSTLASLLCPKLCTGFVPSHQPLPAEISQP